LRANARSKIDLIPKKYVRYELPLAHLVKSITNDSEIDPQIYGQIYVDFDSKKTIFLPKKDSKRQQKSVFHREKWDDLGIEDNKVIVFVIGG
jgi:hypothetical protein